MSALVETPPGERTRSRPHHALVVVEGGDVARAIKRLKCRVQDAGLYSRWRAERKGGLPSKRGEKLRRKRAAAAARRRKRTARHAWFERQHAARDGTA